MQGRSSQLRVDPVAFKDDLIMYFYNADILNGPKTQIVPPGEIATFICHARGNRVYWYINGRYADPQVYNEARGFTITNTEIPRPPNELEEHNNTLTVEARPSNNNTLITCTASGFILGQQDFQEGRLIIAGKKIIS